MSLFILDTAGDQQLGEKNENNHIDMDKTYGYHLASEKASTLIADKKDANESDEDDGDFFGLPPPKVDLSKIINSTLAQSKKRQTAAERDLQECSELVNEAIKYAKDHPRSKRRNNSKLDYSDFNTITGKHDDEALVRVDVEKELASSDVVAGMEQLKELPRLTKRKQRDLNRIERSKTKGAGWFNLPATERTEEVENDLKLLQMRSVLDPKHFYKKNDLKVLPKYFQIGTVQHSPLDYFSERHTRKNKNKSLVEELLADKEAQQFTKRKYKEIVERHDKYARRKATKKMKKLKKKK